MCDSLSDPLVLTGSHNWSSSADTKNDENIVIIHNETIANIYYQAFNYSFTNLGGTLASCGTIGVNELSEDVQLRVFPNPTSGKIQVGSWSALGGAVGKGYKIEIYNVFGEKVYSSQLATASPSFGRWSVGSGQLSNTTNNGQLSTNIDLSSQPSGIYFLKLKTEKGIFVRKIIISH
jgi:hypothetical protein